MKNCCYLINKYRVALVDEIIKHKTRYVFWGIVLYQLICVLHGFDLSDEGWAMYFYQRIFTNPESVVAQMPYWLTGVIGGLWYKVFPEGGFLAMRLLGVVVVTLTSILVYSLLKKTVNSSLILLGVLMQVLIVAGDPKPFGYNSLSALFVVLAIGTILFGMKKRRLFMLFLSGLLLGSNIFIRLPNVASLSLLFLIPLYHYLETGKICVFSKSFLFSLLGLLTSLFWGLMALHISGHIDFFLESINGVVASASDQNNSHQLGTMLLVYLKNYGGILLIGCIVILVGAVFSYARKYAMTKNHFYIIKLITFVLLTFLSVEYNNILRDNDMYFIHFLSYLAILIVLLNFYKERLEIKFFAIASLLMIVFMPLGSDRGIVTIWTSSWMSLPFSIAYLLPKIQDLRINLFIKQVVLCKKYLLEYFKILIIVFLLTAIYKNAYCAYYDLGSIFKKTYSIDNRYCRCIHTNEYRARLMNELLPMLSLYIRADDYLMAYDFIPGINYMTNTISFLPNAWIWCYSGSELKKQIDISVKEKNKMPVLVRQHFIATNKWRDYDPDFYNERRPDTWYFKKERTMVINEFINKYKYRTVWSNWNFEILISDYKFTKI